jgi:hypothetical protein
MPEPRPDTRTIRKLKHGVGWALRLGTVAVAAMGAYVGFEFFASPAEAAWSWDKLLWFLQTSTYIYVLFGFVCILGALADDKD